MFQLTGNARARGDRDLVPHHQTAGLVVEQTSRGRHARPAAIGRGEIGLDGVELDQVGVLDVLVGVIGADDIFSVLLVGALELGIDHTQIAIGDLEATDARRHVANADADGEPRRNEIGGEDQHRDDGEEFAQEADEPGVADGTLKRAHALFGRADSVPPAAGNDIRFNRHLPRPISRHPGIRVPHQLAAGL